MKKILILLLAMTMTFALGSCGSPVTEENAAVINLVSNNNGDLDIIFGNEVLPIFWDAVDAMDESNESGVVLYVELYDANQESLGAATYDVYPGEDDASFSYDYENWMFAVSDDRITYEAKEGLITVSLDEELAGNLYNDISIVMVGVLDQENTELYSEGFEF